MKTAATSFFPETHISGAHVRNASMFIPHPEFKACVDSGVHNRLRNPGYRLKFLPGGIPKQGTGVLPSSTLVNSLIGFRGSSAEGFTWKMPRYRFRKVLNSAIEERKAALREQTT